MNKKLSPLKHGGRTKLKQLREKQKSWVLDCINEQKSKLKPYSAMKDRYLKYFVVRVPKKIRNYSKTTCQDKNQVIDGDQFKSFLEAKKQKIMESQSSLENKTITQGSTNELNPNVVFGNEMIKDIHQLNEQPKVHTKIKGISFQSSVKNQKDARLFEKSQRNENQQVEAKQDQVDSKRVEKIQQKENQPIRQENKDRNISEKIETECQKDEPNLLKQIR